MTNMSDNTRIQLRKATQHDRELLCHIQRTAICELGRMVYTEDEVKAWGDGLCPERYMTKECQCVLIAEIDSCAAGFGILDRDTGEVAAVYVLPAFARQGIGTCILNELLTEANRVGFTQVWCKSSLFAEAFYQKAGFQSGQKGKHQFRNGQAIDYIPMSKSLV